MSYYPEVIGMSDKDGSTIEELPKGDLWIVQPQRERYAPHESVKFQAGLLGYNELEYNIE